MADELAERPEPGSPPAGSLWPFGRSTEPRSLARRELARAVGGALASPLRVAAWLPRRARDRAAVRADLGGRAPEYVAPLVSLPKDRPLEVLLACAEASGEIHGASLVQELRARAAREGAPEPRIVAFGGERLRELGVETIGDPVSRAQSNFDGVVSALPYYVGLLEDAARHAREHRPDVFVPVDSPALHVPMARCVRAMGVPVVHLVAPQYWGWAPWRVRAYRRTIDRALTILPHEPAWYERHGVDARHVGHPLLDALGGIPSTRPPEGSDVLAILPGSRHGVIARNLPWMLEVARRALPEKVRMRVLQSTDEHAGLVSELASKEPRASLAIGDLHGELAAARTAFAVSGTVLTDVLHHRVPTVVVYRVSKRMETWMYRNVLTVPYFASTNLLAGREVLPEFCFRGVGPRAEATAALSRAWTDEAWRAECGAALDAAAERLGPAGAIERAAAHVVEVGIAGRARP